MLAQSVTDLADALGKITFSIGVFVAVVVCVLTLLVQGYLFYYLFSLPRRRLERAMVFLHLVNAGIRRGVTPEDTIKLAVACGDEALGSRFQSLADWLVRGHTWRQALLKVPRLLPPSIREMLMLTDRLGGWQKVFPICERKLQDVVSELRASQSCLSPSILILPLPIIIFTAFLGNAVIPKFHAIAADFEVSRVSFLGWTTSGPFPFFPLLCVLALIPLIPLFFHAGGPGVWSFSLWTGALGDRIDWVLPWQRMRLKRDFATMLGLLLDAGVPEAEAVELAARGTANTIMQQKAGQVKRALLTGQSLPEAIGLIDPKGDFLWRFQQAAAGGTKFETALAGWCESLQAKAGHLQQAVMQGASVVLLLINAGLICLITFDIFGILVRIYEKGAE